jgi:hypothetical protein
MLAVVLAASVRPAAACTCGPPRPLLLPDGGELPAGAALYLFVPDGLTPPAVRAEQWGRERSVVRQEHVHDGYTVLQLQISGAVAGDLGVRVGDAPPVRYQVVDAAPEATGELLETTYEAPRPGCRAPGFTLVFAGRSPGAYQLMVDAGRTVFLPTEEVDGEVPMHRVVVGQRRCDPFGLAIDDDGLVLPDVVMIRPRAHVHEVVAQGDLVIRPERGAFPALLPELPTPPVAAPARPPAPPATTRGSAWWTGNTGLAGGAGLGAVAGWLIARR